MSRKDYVPLADAIKQSLTYAAIDDGEDTDRAVEAVADVARNIAAALKADNPAFRFDRFYEACGLDEWGEVKA